MDLAASDAPMNPQSNDEPSVAEENGEGGEPVVPPPAKKLRFGEEMNRVAEIVLVLSAMGTMRGGKSPTEVELELMAEARSKLAEMCQEITPKDIVGRDAIGVVIEDLGLNGKLKDQRLGFRAPRLTISEKVSLGKRKMEEAKKYPAMSTGTGYTSHMSQQTGGAASPGLSTLGSATHTVRVIDRTNNQSLSSGVVTGSSPYVSVGGNVSMTHQWPSNEFKMSTTSAPTVGSHYVRDTSGLAQSRVERPQIKSEMLSIASQGPATSSANYWSAPTWSAQPQPAFTVTTIADNKVPIQSSVRVTDQSFRPFMSQTPPGTFTGTNQPMQGINYGHTSAFGNNHVEIAKIIHKVLHPRVLKNPSWNPPSREYMNKAMTCQICQATINEVETALICDACEKGYHLKCLQANNLKGVPKSEWHCSRCVQLYNGKSFPIKYGRVMRSANMQKMPSTTAGLQLPTEKKVGMSDPKVNQLKATVTTNPGLQNSLGFASGKSNPSTSISHSETAGSSANTNARAAVTASLGSQGLVENFTNSSFPVPVSQSEAANATATAIATPSSALNNGLVSKGPVAAGSMGSISATPFANWVPANTTPSYTTSSTTASAPMSVGLGSQGPAVSVTRRSSSPASETANEVSPNARLGAQGPAVIGNSTTESAVAVSHIETANATEGAVIGNSTSESAVAVSHIETEGAVIGNSTSESAVAVSHIETANATEGAALSGTVDASSESQDPVGNGAGCIYSSKSKLHLETLHAETISENSQESSKNVIESEVPATCQDHPTNAQDTDPCPSVSQSTVVSDDNSKITAESSMPQENSTCQTEKSVSEPPAVSSDSINNPDHSCPENEVPNVQEAQQNNVEYPLEDNSVDGLKDRHHEHTSEPEEGKSATMNEAALENS